MLLLEAPLEAIFWYDCKTCYHMLLHFFYGHKTMNFEPNLDSQEEVEVTCSEIWAIWWLGDGWNFVLHQKLLHCEGCIKKTNCLHYSAKWHP